MKSRTESKNLLRNSTQPDQASLDEHDTSAIYIRDRETGEWKVRNPAGSMAYNYLYRDDIGMD